MNPGEIKIFASRKGYVTFIHDPFTIDAGGQPNEIAIYLGKVEIEIAVNVIDEEGKPVAGANVSQFGLMQDKQVTDSKGIATLAKMNPKGGERIIVKRVGFTTAYHTISLEEAVSRIAMVTLLKKGK